MKRPRGVFLTPVPESYSVLLIIYHLEIVQFWAPEMTINEDSKKE